VLIKGHVQGVLHVVQGITGQLSVVASMQVYVKVVLHVVQGTTGQLPAVAPMQEYDLHVMHVPTGRSDLDALGRLLVPVRTVLLVATQCLVQPLALSVLLGRILQQE
jgi:hypothetical protein